jgi:hypothetical protein
VVAVIHSLSQSKPEKDHLLKFAIGCPWLLMRILASTPFVLPCLEDMTNNFPTMQLILLFPMIDWKHILAGMKEKIQQGEGMGIKNVL